MAGLSGASGGKGAHIPKISLYTLWSALASAKTDSAPGEDEGVYEMYKELPTTLQLLLVNLFNDRLYAKDPVREVDGSWRKMLLVGLAKELGANRMDKYRWIAKTSSLQKLYLKCVMQLIDEDPDVRPRQLLESTRTVGFSPGGRCMHITEAIRELCFGQQVWGGVGLIFQGDIRTAFDSVPHWVLEQALQYMNINKIIIAATLREYRDLWLQAEVGDSGLCRPVPFHRGGRQGGVETPRLFNYVTKYILDPLVAGWNRSGRGIFVGYNDEMELLHHDAWADNIWLYAKDDQELRAMVKEVTAALLDHGLQWKQGSLLQMAIGDEIGHSEPWSFEEPIRGEQQGPDDLHHETFDLLSAIFPELLDEGAGERFEVQDVTELDMLGVRVTNVGDTEASIIHRLSAAGKLLYKYKYLFMSKHLSWEVKLKAWCKTVHRCVLYGAGGWHLDQRTLRILISWERHQLRKVLRLRRAPEENYRAYRIRTARRIDDAFRNYGLKRVSETAIEEVVSWAQYCTHSTSWQAQRVTFMYTTRNRRWWQECASTLQWKDPLNLTHWRHRHSGPTRTWEDLLCAEWDVTWASRLPAHKALLKEAQEEIVRGTCKRLALGKWPHKPPKGEHPDEQRGKDLKVKQQLLESFGHPVWTLIEEAHINMDRQFGLPLLHFTDSKVLASWTQGKAEVWDVNRRADVRELGGVIEDFVSNNLYHTLCHSTWLVHWVRREHNKAADLLCNWALDYKEDVLLTHKPWEPKPQSILISFSDGAVRGDDKASCGVVILDVADGCPELVVALAVQLPDATTPMSAEITGLKLAFSYLYAMYNERHNVQELVLADVLADAQIRLTADGGNKHNALLGRIFENLNVPNDGLYIQKW